MNVQDMMMGKKLLITGGTGSFGNAVLNHFLKSQVEEIRIFSRDEKKQDDMRILYNNPKLKFYIGDVRDFQSIKNALSGVDYIFHSAALKQVPSCEFYPLEAVKTNVLGTENVLQSATESGVKKVIVLSTDKAVYPINAMGISKAMMEKITIAKSRNFQQSEITFCATRYGNVMGSRGSVIPLFLNQIKLGRPVTVTHPQMTRFMMSLQQSVELVNFAFGNARPGDIFVQKAPAATVETIAQALQNILGKQTGIEIMGIRHGEKMHETLASREEMSKAVDLGNFLRIPADNRDLNYSKYLEQGTTSINATDDYTSKNTKQLSVEETESLLLGLDFIQEALK